MVIAEMKSAFKTQIITPGPAKPRMSQGAEKLAPLLISTPS